MHVARALVVSLVSLVAVAPSALAEAPDATFKKMIVDEGVAEALSTRCGLT